jgi:hypothetical protein
MKGLSDMTTAPLPHVETQEQRIARELSNAKRLDLTRVSHDSAFDEAIASLLDVIEIPGHKKLVERCMKLLLIEMARLYGYRPNGYIMYSRDRNWWAEHLNHPENPSRITYKIVEIISLLSPTFLEHHIGYRSDTGSKLSRMRPAQSLIDIIECYHLHHCVTEKHPDVPRLIVKGVRGAPLRSLPNTREKREIIKKMEAYNALLQEADIDIEVSSPVGIFFDLCEVGRTFNNGSFEFGGRYTNAWWLNVNKHLRKQIKINGESTVELDFKGQHIYLLYGLKGVNYKTHSGQEDPYKVSSHYDRSVIKRASLILINAKNPEQARAAFNESYYKDIKRAAKRGEYEKLEQLKEERSRYANQLVYLDIIEQFTSHHQLIADCFCSGIGIELMNKDSRIAEYIINEMTNRQIVVLSVHDSFIVQAEYKDLLKEIMNEAYTSLGMSNSLPPIHTESTSAE